VIPRRRVNFSRIDPEQSRQIFIQGGLVEDALRGEYDFLLHNQKLLARLQEIEDRVRKRDVVVDEQTIYSFYEQRLPEHIHDQRGLNQLIKKRGGDGFLRMSEADVLHRLPGEEQLERFPETLEFDGIKVHLVYRFNPGAEDDGVNVLVPYNLLPHLHQQSFEWLVPGMLADKVTFLLKSLPKHLRRVLVPVPASVEKVLAELTPYRGSLYRSLEVCINKLFDIRVMPQHWPVDLPSHLLVRFCAVDGKGAVVKASRNLEELTGSDLRAAARDDDQISRLRQKWRRPIENITDLGEIPDRLPLVDNHGNICGYLCPALTIDDEGKGVILELLDDPVEAENRNRRGMLTLYRKEFAQHIKPVRKDLCLKKNQWTLCEGIYNLDEINDGILDFILAEIFETGEGVIPQPETIREKIARIRNSGFYDQASTIFEEIVLVLTDRRAVFDEIKRFSARGGFYAKLAPQFIKQAERIVARKFLTVSARKDLQKMRRYLKALMIRMERAKVDPNKDSAKADKIAPFERRQEEVGGYKPQTPDQQRLVFEFIEMVEEFKISLFAQELKTAFPVSEKRLEEKWREVVLSGAVRQV
jgi:ATP-dependent helicase HrpA